MGVGARAESVRAPEAMAVEKSHQKFLEKAVKIPAVLAARRRIEEILQQYLHISPNPTLAYEGSWEDEVMVIKCYFSISVKEDSLLYEHLAAIRSEVELTFKMFNIPIWQDTVSLYDNEPGKTTLTFVVLRGEVSETMVFFPLPVKEV